MPALPFRPVPGAALPGRSRPRPRRGRFPAVRGPARLRMVDSRRLEPGHDHAELLSDEGLNRVGAGVAGQAGADRRARSRTWWRSSRPCATEEKLSRYAHWRHAATSCGGAAAGGGLAHPAAGPPGPATPADMEAAIRAFAGGAPIRNGKVDLDMPPLVENGNSVPLTVTVEKPDDAEGLRARPSPSSTRRTRSRTSPFST